MAFTAPVPVRARWPFAIRSDGPGREVSRLVLTEDGRPLGPEHVGHDAIRLEGRGRYSHWGRMILFSTSDGSDPRTNGRVYAVSVRPHASPTLGGAAAVIALGSLLLFRRRFLAFLTSAGPKLAIGSLLVLLMASLLTAAGVFGHVVLRVDEPKDAALVGSLVWHSVLGILITLIQCLVGAGAIRLFSPAEKTPFAAALLLGFPISLALLALLTVVALTLPWGHALAALGIAGLLARLRHDLPAVREWRRTAIMLAGLAVPALVFGIWLGLLWHGPTETLPGMPSGDLVFYTALVTMLKEQAWPIPNLGNEGESFQPYNTLWPALGAGLAKLLPIEPFAFVITSGASAFIVVTFLMLFAYLRARGRSINGGEALLLTLAMLVAGRYPFWIVESIPQIHTTALTIALWFWVTAKTGLRFASLSASLALAGALLTKVASAVTLVPLALGAMTVDLRVSSMRARIVGVTIAGIAALIGAYMMWTFGPRFIAVGGIGPDSYVWLEKWRSPFGAAAPFLLRDIGALVLALAATQIRPWWVAASVIGGLLASLALPFVLRAAFVAAVVLITLGLLDHDARRTKTSRLAVSGLIFCLPAMLWTDPGGNLTGLVWAVSISAAMYMTIAQLTHSPPKRAVYGMSMASFALAAFLVAVARGHVGLGSNWLQGKHKLTPEIYTVWKTVREVVPPGSLVFTDQTGPDWGLLGGWNTYAFHGARQLFISTWVQSGELQADEPRRLAKLAWNDRVLQGEVAPTQVPVRGRYDHYYAVVRRERIAALTGWTLLRLVESHAILVWSAPR